MSRQWYVRVTARAEFSDRLGRHTWTMSSPAPYPISMPKVSDGVHYLNVGKATPGETQVHFVSHDSRFAVQVAREWIDREQRSIEFAEKQLRDWATTTVTAVVREVREVE